MKKSLKSASSGVNSAPQNIASESGAFAFAPAVNRIRVAFTSSMPTAVCRGDCSKLAALALSSAGFAFAANAASAS